MPRHKRVQPIETNQQIANEVRRIYRECRREELNTSDAWVLVRILKALVEIMRDGDIEVRLGEIERKVQEGPWAASRH